MIYVDELALLNFVIDYILLSTLAKILKINVKSKRVFLSCLIGEISILYLFINTSSYILWIFKFILSILMILISFGYKDIKSFSERILYFYCLS